MIARDPLSVMLKQLRRDYEAHVQPALRRHAAALSPGVRRRLKARAARHREQRRLERAARNGGAGR